MSAKAKMRAPVIRVERKTGNLIVDFTWRGVRLQPSTGEKDSLEARARLEQKLLSMEWHMKNGSFVPTEWFPDSRAVHRNFPVAGTPAPGEQVVRFGPWIRQWHQRRSPFRADGTLEQDYEIAPTTWLHDQGTIELFVQWFGDDRPLEEVDRALCLQFRAYLREAPVGRRKKPRAPKTIRSILGLLHCAFAEEFEGDETRLNPVPPAGRKGSRQQMRRDRRQGVIRTGSPLSVEELWMVLDNLPARIELRGGGFIDRATLFDLYTVWVRTGLRSNEPFALRFEALDWVRQGFMLTHARSPKAGGIEAEPKTGARWVDCSGDPQVFEAFERRRRAVLATGVRNYVFSDSRGHPLSQDLLYKRVWKPTLRRIGIAHRTQNDGMRDTWISHAIASGEQIPFIAARTGTSHRMIMDHYLGRIERGSDGRLAAASLDRPGPDSVRTVSELAIAKTGAGPGLNLQPADRSRKTGQRGGSKRSGGGGNRTPVREHSTDGYYTLSSRFDLVASTPVSGMLATSLEDLRPALPGCGACPIPIK
jgi:integrase